MNTELWAPSFATLEQAVLKDGSKELRRRFWEARRSAQELHERRVRALRLLAEGTSLPLEQLPPPVAEYSLSSEDTALSPPLKVRLAYDIIAARETDVAIQAVENELWGVESAIGQRILDATQRLQHELIALLVTYGLLLVITVTAHGVSLWFLSEETKIAMAMVDLGERLSGVSSIDQASELVLQVADQLIGWDAASLAVLAPDGKRLETTTAHDIVDGKRQRVYVSREWKPTDLTRRVLTGESVFILRGRSDAPPFKLRPFGNTERRSQSLMFVPIRKGEQRAIGLMTIQSYRAHAYTQNDLQLLEWLASRFATAFEHARLVQALRESEERYRILSEANVDGVFVHDGISVLFCNPALAQILGYDSPTEIVGKLSAEDLVHPEDRPRWRDVMARRMAGERQERPLRVRLMRKDGEYVFCESLGTTVWLGDRKVVIGTLREVTAQVRAEEERRRLHEIYRRAILSANAVPYRLDFHTKRYDFPSEEIQRITGYSAEELSWEAFSKKVIAKEVFFPRVEAPDNISPDNDVERRLEETRRNKILRGEVERFHAEYLFERKDGRLVWLSDSAVTERDDRGKVIAAIGILQDITPRKRLERRAQVFAELGAKLGIAETATEAAETIAEAATKLFEWHSCNIRAIDTLTGEMVSLVCFDTIGGTLQQFHGENRSSPPSPLEQRALAGEAIFITDRETDSLAQLLTSFGNPTARSESVMLVGIRSGDKALGTMSFQSYRKHAFTKDDLEDLRALATYCATGLERVQIYESLAVSESQMRTIWEHAAIAMRLTDSDGTVWMVNPAYCQLVGMSEEELVGKPFTIAYPPEEREEKLDHYRRRFREKSFETGKIIWSITLWNKHQLVVELESRLIKTAYGEMVLSLLADRTREYQLQEELQRKNKELEMLATTDSLTGLANRRLALTLFERELGRARRYRFLLCALMLDIDRFKKINDTYGHLMGDEVLRRLGTLIRENVRAVDVAGRYGGEEFLVVMPETGLPGALVFAERLRARVAELEFVTERGEQFHITVSIGIAQCEDAETTSMDDLLAAADRALYQAKREGRNRVAVA